MKNFGFEQFACCLLAILCLLVMVVAFNDKQSRSLRSTLQSEQNVASVFCADTHRDQSHEKCLNERLAEIETRHLSRRNVLAQERLSLSAMFALAMSIVTAALLYFTWWETRNGTRETKKIGVAQNRAYLSVTHIEIRFSTDIPASGIVEKIHCVDFRIARIFPYIKNSGQTPALWFELKQHTFFSEQSNTSGKDITRRFDRMPLENRKFQRWHGIASNESLSVGTGSKDDLLVPEEAAENQGWNFFVCGILRYETIFNEVFESEYWFMIQAAKIPRNGEPFSRNDLTGHEIVLKMSRVEATEMRHMVPVS